MARAMASLIIIRDLRCGRLSTRTALRIAEAATPGLACETSRAEMGGNDLPELARWIEGKLSDCDCVFVNLIRSRCYGQRLMRNGPVSDVDKAAELLR